MLHPAGRSYHYSNPGTAALGHVVELVRGRPWWDCVREEILEPLGLIRTTYHPQDPHADGLAVHPYTDLVLTEPAIDTMAMAPAGRLWSTVADLARWGAFLAGSADPGAEPVLTMRSREEMRRPIHVAEGPEWSWGYGLGVTVVRTRGRRLVGHGGTMPGFVASLLADESSGTVAVALANSTGSPPDGLSLDLLDLLDEYEPVAPPEWVPAAIADDVRELLGTWFWGPHPYVLTALPNGWIDLHGGGVPASRFERAGRPGPGWTGTSPASTCARSGAGTDRWTSSTSARSASPGSRTTPTPTYPEASTRQAGGTGESGPP